MREHKAWLEFWQETFIDFATYDRDVARVGFTHSKCGGMRIVFGVTEKPKRVLLNSEEIQYRITDDGKLVISPESDGLLEVCF
jgi:hypothetical protein